MMKTVQEIFNYLCTLAPLELQLDFDNSGHLVGHRSAKVSKVLLSLDLTESVLAEALAEQVQLIVTHHPVIWDPVKSLTDSDNCGTMLLSLVENRIAVISMHTNLDIAQGGVNDILLERLGARAEAGLDSSGCGRIGHLPAPERLDVFLQDCKAALNANGLRYYDAGRPVYKLAVMGGAGADAIEDAFRAGCDTYVTSDIKYHQFLMAGELGVNLVDADHFCTENPIIPALAEALQQQFPDIDFKVSKSHRQLISFL